MSFVSLAARIRRPAGIASLLLILVAQVLPWTAFGPQRGPGAVKASAIASARALEICPHHPQGCPPDCHCPKVRLEAGQEETGSVAGPTLVRCTALGDSLTPAAPGPCLPAGPIAFVLPDRMHALPASPEPATARGFRTLPAKIPIA